MKTYYTNIALNNFNNFILPL